MKKKRADVVEMVLGNISIPLTTEYSSVRVLSRINFATTTAIIRNTLGEWDEWDIGVQSKYLAKWEWW